MIENAKNSHLHSEAPEGEALVKDGTGDYRHGADGLCRAWLLPIPSIAIVRYVVLVSFNRNVGPSFVLVDGYHLELEG